MIVSFLSLVRVLSICRVIVRMWRAGRGAKLFFFGIRKGFVLVV